MCEMRAQEIEALYYYLRRVIPSGPSEEAELSSLIMRLMDEYKKEHMSGTDR